jgi:hypothetical protein
MNQPKTIAINGIRYDAHSGLPIAPAGDATVTRELRRAQSVHAKGIHRSPQRSKSLNRQVVAKHQPARTFSDIRRPATAKSPLISKFAPSAPSQPKAKAHPPVHDIGPLHHPVVDKAHAAAQKARQPVQPTSAHETKQAAISQALAKAKPDTSKRKHKRSSRGRILNVVSATAAVLLIAGYFTYLNLPGLSVKVAAVQAGIDASYPSYRPVGYSLHGPVAFRDGEVSMEFASNAGPQHFTLAQAKSSWDSSALLEKYVNPHSDGHYATYTDAGLTIYTFGNDAAWVNGGLLYTVDGTATLSNDQVRRIATSL